MEKNNLIDSVDPNVLNRLRKKLNSYLLSKSPQGVQFSQKEKAKINDRLRKLGYIH